MHDSLEMDGINPEEAEREYKRALAEAEREYKRALARRRRRRRSA